MTDSSELTGAARRQRGFLGFIEKVGNVLPDPIMIFVYLIGFLMILSAIGDALGWSASLAYPGDEAPEGGTLENGVLTYTAVSLFSEDNIRRLFTEMPRTLTGFAPLGLVLLVMFGAGVAIRWLAWRRRSRRCRVAMPATSRRAKSTCCCSASPRKRRRSSIRHGP